jgi:hypothetical protein
MGGGFWFKTLFSARCVEGTFGSGERLLVQTALHQNSRFWGDFGSGGDSEPKFKYKGRRKEKGKTAAQSATRSLSYIKAGCLGARRREEDRLDT